MSRAVAGALLVLSAGFAMALVYFLATPPESRLAPFTDAEYVARAERTQEARAFLAKYPDARRAVERSGAVTVDFRVDRGARYLRLRIFMDAFANRALDALVDCSGTVVPGDPLEYLPTETCLGPA